MEPWYTIEVVKERIRDKDDSHVPVMEQVLVHGGRLLSDHRTLADYSIVSSDFRLDNACRHVIPANTKPTTASPTATVLDLKPATYFDPSDTAHVAAVMDTDHTSEHVLRSFKSKAAESLCATVGVPGAITAGQLDFIANECHPADLRRQVGHPLWLAHCVTSRLPQQSMCSFFSTVDVVRTSCLVGARFR